MGGLDRRGEEERKGKGEASFKIPLPYRTVLHWTCSMCLLVRRLLLCCAVPRRRDVLLAITTESRDAESRDGGCGCAGWGVGRRPWTYGVVRACVSACVGLGLGCSFGLEEAWMGWEGGWMWRGVSV